MSLYYSRIKSPRRPLCSWAQDSKFHYLIIIYELKNVKEDLVILHLILTNHYLSCVSFESNSFTNLDMISHMKNYTINLFK